VELLECPPVGLAEVMKALLSDVVVACLILEVPR
jgi:hypothetical protein